MYATTFFTLDGDGVEIAGDLRSRLEWRVVRRAGELADEACDILDRSAWAQAEEEIIGQFSGACALA